MKNSAGLKACAALYYNPIPLDEEGFFVCVCVDISTGLTLSQSIFFCFLGNAAYATITGGDRWAEGESRLQIQRERERERWRDNHRNGEGFPVPPENLTGVPNNKLKPSPPPPLYPVRADHPTAL